MDKPLFRNRWRKVTREKRPAPLVPVLVDVDGEVREGWFNDRRNLWFCGERPIYPQYWRPMPQLPKGMRK